MNQNTKGFEFEKSIARTLGDYLGSEFEFHVRSQIIDVNLDYLNIFSVGQNEFDIVATFRSASPKIIMRIGDAEYVPYDSVAFILEIKTKMDKTRLADDLEKLKKLALLPLTKTRFSLIIASDKFVMRPLRLLFYYESSIDETTESKLLTDYYEYWDVIYKIQNDEVILNSSLPAVKHIMSLHGINQNIIKWGGNNCAVVLLTIISSSVPTPLRVNIIETFLNLDRYSNL
jgi:hypothetical protein